MHMTRYWSRMIMQSIYIFPNIRSYIGDEIETVYGCRYMMRRGAGSGCGGSYWASMVPKHREEIIEELEDYKAGLEAEILALEKRIKDLKERGKEEKKE